MTDDDLAALVGYLRTVPPVDRVQPEVRVGPAARILYLLGDFPLLPVELVHHDAARPNPAPGVTVEYGR